LSILSDGLYDWVTRGTNAGFNAGVGVGPVSLDAAAGFGIGPANLGAGGEPVSKVDEEISVAIYQNLSIIIIIIISENHFH